MSIRELIQWKPTPFQRQMYGIHPDFHINPTWHAVSLSGTKEERTEVYTHMEDFVADPQIARRLNETFHPPVKAFRDRPPLRIVPDAKSTITGSDERYGGYIFKMPTTSLFFVLENETHPLASVGFNQFSDGVEIRYYQGVRTDKIGESAKDFDRLGNGLEKLAALVEDYARYEHLAYAMILPAAENMWVHETTFPMERAKRIYDDTADRRGYDYNPKLRRFIKTLA